MTPDEARLRELADRLRAFRRLLKSGEYDGADLMRAWCAMVDAADGLEHLLDALSAERERVAWRPISEAPHRPQRSIILWNGEYVTVGYRGEDGWVADQDSDSGIPIEPDPTHFQLLPSPPLATQKAEGAD